MEAAGAVLVELVLALVVLDRQHNLPRLQQDKVRNPREDEGYVGGRADQVLGVEVGVEVEVVQHPSEGQPEQPGVRYLQNVW